MPVRDPGAVSQYKDCVIPREVAAYVARWKPAAGTAGGGGVVRPRRWWPAAEPLGRDRAKNLLWATASRLLRRSRPGLEPVPRKSCCTRR